MNRGPHTPSEMEALLHSYVAVYGTLKRGYGNHHRLLGARFIGEGRTKSLFSMVDSGFPVIQFREGEENWPVQVEVYNINHAEADAIQVLRSLDALEGEGHMYRRELVDVSLPKAKRKVRASIYVGMHHFSSRPHSNEAFLRGEELVWPTRARESMYRREAA